MHHPQILQAGARVFAISVDPPERNAAMISKLSLPFPYLSDPDRSQAITPYGVADEKDHRHIARPSIVVVTPAREEAFRLVSRDFADRPDDDLVLAALDRLQLPSTRQERPATTQEPPANGEDRLASGAMSTSQLKVYFRGARFAAQAMGLRHAHFAEEIKIDSKAYVAQMDRFTAALDWLRQNSSPDAPR